MTNKLVSCLVLLLFLFVFFLIRKNNDLARLNLHAERSVQEMIQSKKLTENLLFSATDSLFQVRLKDGLIVVVNRINDIASFRKYLENTFPSFSVQIVGNRSAAIEDTAHYTVITPLPPALTIQRNILIFSVQNRIQHLFVYEPENPWLLNADLKILRKYYEEKI